jgi:hypothetical protein
MISNLGMELLELFLLVASNSLTKTFIVMGCKGPISHLFQKRVFQHRTSWSIIVSLQKHQHPILGEILSCQKINLNLDKLQRIQGNSHKIIEQAFLHNGRKPTIRLKRSIQCLYSWSYSNLNLIGEVQCLPSS